MTFTTLSKKGRRVAKEDGPRNEAEAHALMADDAARKYEFLKQTLRVMVRDPLVNSRWKRHV